MRWETKNRINNINQLNKIRQENKTKQENAKNELLEEKCEILTKSEHDYDKFIEFCESMHMNLEYHQKQIIKALFDNNKCFIAMPKYNGYEELLNYLNKSTIFKNKI